MQQIAMHGDKERPAANPSIIFCKIEDVFEEKKRSNTTGSCDIKQSSIDKPFDNLLWNSKRESS